MLSVVIPCYNESANLEALVAKCNTLLDSAKDVEIILVDNGSTDSTPQLMKSLLEKHANENLRTHRVEVNEGYGFGITEGLNRAQGDFLGWTHADLQTDLNDCLTAYELIKKGNIRCTAVKGRRKNRSLFDVLFTWLMSLYVLFKLGIYLPDINAQPKIFRKAFWDKIAGSAPKDFSLDLYLLVKARRENGITDFPVYFHQRVAGEAKGGGSGDINLKIKLAKRSISYINKLSNAES